MHESVSQTGGVTTASDGLRRQEPNEAVYGAALAGLQGMTPVRLVRLLDGFDPSIAWHAVAAGTHPGDRERRFQAGASSTDAAAVGNAYARAGVSILLATRWATRPGWSAIVANRRSSSLEAGRRVSTVGRARPSSGPAPPPPMDEAWPPRSQVICRRLG